MVTKEERDRFNAKWKDFIASDPDNKKVYGSSLSYERTSKKNGNILSYKSEQLIPTKTDKHLPLLLVLGNPATH